MMFCPKSRTDRLPPVNKVFPVFSLGKHGILGSSANSFKPGRQWTLFKPHHNLGGDEGDRRAAGESKNPASYNSHCNAPAHRGKPACGAYAHDGRGDGVSGGERYPKARGEFNLSKTPREPEIIRWQ
jgi:hypothetical protein